MQIYIPKKPREDFFNYHNISIQISLWGNADDIQFLNSSVIFYTCLYGGEKNFPVILS